MREKAAVVDGALWYLRARVFASYEAGSLALPT